jgi:LysR family glycine cleavage system transcriptional activator/LysR family transcriptional regulator of beta-lactamase
MRAYEAAARLGSVAAAADELNVTRPAISKQIRSLELEIGVPLLVRTGNSIRMTAEGRELFVGLQEAFQLISVTTARLASRARLGPKIRPRVCRDFASSWLGARIGEFLIGNPGISVEITADTNGSFRLDEDFDFRIFYGFYGNHASGALSESTLCHWVDVPLCTPEYADKFLSVDDKLADVHFLIDNNYDVWNEWCHYSGFSPRARRHATYFNETTLCVSVACSGDGLTISDSFLSLSAITSGQLTVAFPAGLTSAQSYSLFTPANHDPTPAETKFERWLYDAIQRHQAKVLEELTSRNIRIIERDNEVDAFNSLNADPRGA